MREILTPAQEIDAATEFESIEILRELAQPHVGSSDGKLSLLPAEPGTYPAQVTAHIKGEPIEIAHVDAIASIAEPLFPELKARLMHIDHQAKISAAGEILSRGGNLVVATNHSKLIDIALAQAALYGALKEQAPELNTAIVLGKMISVVAFQLGDQKVPAVDALKMLCDDIYLSYPRTQSVRQSRLAQEHAELMSRNNADLSTELAKNLARGGVMLAIAPSGTTDKLTRQRGYVLGPVNKGTCRILCDPRTHVLPVAVWMDKENPVMQPVDEPRQLGTRHEVHDMMHAIADTLSEQVEDKDFVYGSRAGAVHL